MERRETHDRGTSPGQPGTIKPFQGGGGGVADAMMSNPEPSLPLLPGTSCADPTKTDFHRSQTLNYSHGYAMARRPTVGIGGDQLQVNQLSQADLDELANKAPLLTYGEPKQAAPPEFIPAHVAFDKKPAPCCGCHLGQQAQAPQAQGQEKAPPQEEKQN